MKSIKYVKFGLKIRNISDDLMVWQASSSASPWSYNVSCRAGLQPICSFIILLLCLFTNPCKIPLMLRSALFQVHTNKNVATLRPWNFDNHDFKIVHGNIFLSTWSTWLWSQGLGFSPRSCLERTEKNKKIFIESYINLLIKRQSKNKKNRMDQFKQPKNGSGLAYSASADLPW